MSEELSILRPLKTYFPTVYSWVDTHRERSIIGLSAALAVTTAAIAWNVIDLASTHRMLERMDENYEAKCMSFEPEIELSAPGATDRTNNILYMMARFGDRGSEQATLLDNSDTIFCYGMENQEQPNKDYWPNRHVYFIDAEYPDEMAALFYYEGANEEFWDTHVESPAKVRDYVPESGLLFSRFDRANRATELIDNYASAIWADGGSPSYMGSWEWEVFLEENPELREPVLAYTSTLGDGTQNDAALQATFTYMTDPDLLDQGDLDFMAGYHPHVKILSQSSVEPIYTASGKGDWAFVDIDRDGRKDDGIQVTGRGQILNNNIVIDGVETIKPDLHRKTEVTVSVCFDADMNASVCTSIDNVSAKVYYPQVPADETATVHLDPQTLVDMAGMTGRHYLTIDAAEAILSQPSEYYDGELEYLRLHSDQAEAQMRLIEADIETNIPDHDTGESVAGVGLIEPEPVQ